MLYVVTGTHPTNPMRPGTSERVRTDLGQFPARVDAETFRDGLALRRSWQKLLIEERSDDGAP